MSNFYTDVLQNSPVFESSAIHNDLALLEPVTRRKVEAILSDAKKNGYNLMVFETYRSQQRQEMLFREGATQLQHVGCHGFGVAADIVHNVDGKPSWDNLHIVYHLAIVHNLVSGQNWHYPNPPKIGGFVDMPHVQRVNLSDQKRLFNGSWYPDENYRPY